MDNHLKRMRREGKITRGIDLVIDSVIIEMKVKSLRRSRFEKIGGRKIRGKFYKGFKAFVAIDFSTKVLLFIEFCSIREDASKKLIPIVKAVRKLGFHIQIKIVINLCNSNKSQPNCFANSIFYVSPKKKLRL